MSALVILQARMTSTRLPGKVMSEVNGKPMIFWQIQRILQANKVGQLVVATSNDFSDDRLAHFLERSGIAVHRGQLHDVFARYLDVVNANPGYDIVVRLTGDCPLVMPNLMDTMINEFQEQQVDYYSNCNPPTYPDGLDIEIFTRAALIRLTEFQLTDQEREHVTLGFHNEKYGFLVANKSCPTDYSSMRWTVDYQEDLVFIKRIYENFLSKETLFDFYEVIELLQQSPAYFSMLSGDLRNNSIQQER